MTVLLLVIRSSDGFYLNTPQTAVKCFTRSRLNGHHRFLQAARLEIQNAMMAIGIVARSTEERAGRPTAPRFALLRVITTPTKAPQVVHGTLAKIAQTLAPLPNRAQ